MFLGSYTLYFTGKNRVLLPKKIRAELGNSAKFYLILGLDGEIWGFDEVHWQKEAGKRLEIPLTDREGRIARRIFFSQTEECLLDPQGRFILPQEFIEESGIKEEILIIGAGDHFEIWHPQRWQQVMKGHV